VKRSASIFVLLLFLSITLAFPQIEMVKAEGTIYIRAEGKYDFLL